MCPEFLMIFSVAPGMACASNRDALLHT